MSAELVWISALVLGVTGWLAIGELEPKDGFRMFGQVSSDSLQIALFAAASTAALGFIISATKRMGRRVGATRRATLAVITAVTTLAWIAVMAVCALTFVTQPNRERILIPDSQDEFVIQWAPGPLPAAANTYVRLFSGSGTSFTGVNITMPRADSNRFEAEGFEVVRDGGSYVIQYLGSEGAQVRVTLPTR